MRCTRQHNAILQTQITQSVSSQAFRPCSHVPATRYAKKPTTKQPKISDQQQGSKRIQRFKQQQEAIRQKANTKRIQRFNTKSLLTKNTKPKSQPQQTHYANQHTYPSTTPIKLYNENNTNHPYQTTKETHTNHTYENDTSNGHISNDKYTHHRTELHSKINAPQN